MEKIIQAFAYRSRAVIAILIIILLWGWVAYQDISKESNPDIDIPVVSIFVSQQGISPEDARTLLTAPLEKALKNLEGLKKITSYSREGSASILVEFNTGKKEILQDVRAKVEDTIHKLPHDADKPIIREYNTSLFPVLSVILKGDLPTKTLIKIAHNLRDQLEGIPEVLDVRLDGEKEEIIEITVSPEMLTEYKLSLSALREIIHASNNLLPVGTIQLDTGEYQIKMPGIIKDFQEIRELPIKIEGDRVLKFKDIADIKRTFRESSSYVRVNGEPALSLSIRKRLGTNIIATVDNIKQVVASARQSWPETLEVLYNQDLSHEITSVITELENSLIISTLLVSIIIMKTVGGRSALLIAISLPFSFLFSILILYFMGMSLNMVVLFSLILTVGMVVDDAIVVGEYADRYIQAIGVRKSYIMAASRMFWPIFTSTLVKIIVFCPLLFWPGVTGEFMKFMPITVMIILTASLIFAILLQPALGSVFGHSNQNKGTIFSKLNDFYTSLLSRVMDRPKTIIGGILILLFGMYIFFIVKGTGVQFFPEVEPELGVIIVRSEENLSLKQKDEILKNIESKILDMENEVKIFHAVSGASGSRLPDDAIGTINLQLQDWRHRRKAYQIFAEIEKRLADIVGVKINIEEQSSGPSSGKPIEIELYGPSVDLIFRQIQDLYRAMREIGGMKDIVDNAKASGIEWHVAVDKTMAARYKVSQSELSRLLQLLTIGFKISSYRPIDSTEEIDIIIKFPKADIKLEQLYKLRVTNVEGESIPISNFTTISGANKTAKIKAINGKVVGTIEANVVEGVLATDKIRKLKDWLEHNKPEGISYRFGGDKKDISDTFSFLTKAFLAGLAMMTMVMLIQFNNFYHTLVVMSAVFLSTLGVLLELIITWQPFGVVMCGIGIIALAGIVLNNNIIFIDTYRRLRKEGVEVKAAILKTGQLRLRPILLTATTAILGLLPMMLGINIDIIGREITINAPSGQLWRQLSISIVGGLTFATLLTLFITPVLLLLDGPLERVFNRANC